MASKTTLALLRFLGDLATCLKVVIEEEIAREGQPAAAQSDEKLSSASREEEELPRTPLAPEGSVSLTPEIPVEDEMVEASEDLVTEPVAQVEEVELESDPMPVRADETAQVESESTAEVMAEDASEELVSEDSAIVAIENVAELALASVQAAHEEWAQRTHEVLQRGNFREMTDLLKQLNYMGRSELANRVTDEFAHRNRLQAEALVNDRHVFFVRFSRLVEAGAVDSAYSMLLDELPLLERRYNERLNSHVLAQLEHVEGASIEEIRSSFQAQIQSAGATIRDVEGQRQHQIKVALNGGVDPKDAKRVRDLVCAINAHMQNRNFGAIRGCLNHLRSKEREFAAIAHFKSESAFDSFVREVERATNVAEAEQASQKSKQQKSKKRQEVSVPQKKGGPGKKPGSSKKSKSSLCN